MGWRKGGRKKDKGKVGERKKSGEREKKRGVGGKRVAEWAGVVGLLKIKSARAYLQIARCV